MGVTVKLKLLAKDGESRVNECHAVYLDEAGWCTVQGDLVDAETSANLENLLPGEGAVRLKPQVLIDAVRSYVARTSATQVRSPEDTEFNELFERSRYSIFRLETLPRYGGSGEDEALAAFLAGEPYMPSELEDWWVGLARANREAGCVMRRVHVVPEPLTDYLRFEMCWGYAGHVAAGEDIRLIPVAEGEAWPAGVPQSDFWLFDSHRLFDMHYDDEGGWLGVEPVDDPARIVAANQARDAALHRAIPWHEYISTRPELSALIPAEVTDSAV